MAILSICQRGILFAYIYLQLIAEKTPKTKLDVN